MLVTLVHVHVKPENVQGFIEASLENSRASIEEPGCLRFDVLQSEDGPCRFVLYEAYATSEDVSAHKSTPHYLKWRDTVADWMAEPRQGIKYEGLS